MKRREHQSGFSIVEAVVIVAAIGIICAAGWFVYQHNRPKATNAASNTNQTTNSQTTTTPTQTTTYFTITEWGVRAPYSGSLKLSYKMSSDKRTATFSSDQLTALSSDCVGYGGALVRWAKDDLVSEGTPTANTPTAASYFAGKGQSTYAHIADYY